MASMAVVTVGGSQLRLSPAIASGKVSPRSYVAQCGSSTTARLLGAGPLRLLSTSGSVVVRESRRRLSIVAKASETQVDPSEAATDALKTVQEAWEKIDDKLAFTGLGFAGLILLWASNGLISAIDKLPLIPDFFELVGILFTGWFTYRYLLFKPDREELVKIVGEAKTKITGQ